jgi:protein-disulfide isomerase
VRVVYKHFVVHPDTATPAHKAACAAGKQGKFMEFKKLFWEKGFGQYAKTRDPSVMSAEAVAKMAAEIGLDTDKFATDVASADCVQRLRQDMQVLSKFGVNATPSFFVNGRFTGFAGPGPFKKLIDEELEKAEKSGVAPRDYYQNVVMRKGLKQFRSKAEAEKGG